MKPAIRLAVAGILLLTSGALAEGPIQHPFAGSPASPNLNLFSPSWLQWGPTTLSYSHGWNGSSSVYSQGFLLKDINLAIAPHLNFTTRFGLAFSPMTQLSGSSGQPQLVLPYAALTWQPSKNMILKLEYSQVNGGPLGVYPYSHRPLGAWSRASEGEGESSLTP